MRKRLISAFLHFAVLIALFWALFPIFFVFQASLRPGQRLYSTELSLWPEEITWENFRYVIYDLKLPLWARNSFFVAAFTTVMCVCVATSAAFAFSRFRFVGREFCLILFLAFQSFPGLLSLVPLYQILRALQLTETLWGLIVAYTAGTLVFCTWNLKGYFDTLPIELEEAALIDGCSPTQAFIRIALPLARPAIAVTALFGFLAGWNEFPLASVLIHKPQYYTLPVGLYLLETDHAMPWGYFAAGSLLVTIPTLVVFLFLQRHLEAGLTLGGLKG